LRPRPSKLSAEYFVGRFLFIPPVQAWYDSPERSIPMIRAHLSSCSRRRAFGRVTPWFVLGLAGAILIQPGCAPSKPEFVPTPHDVTWFGVHVLVENKKDARALLAEIPHLAELGVNLLIAEVDYNYEYVSHPELRGPDPISAETAKMMVDLCRSLGIRLIPEFQSLGHQSWDDKTFALLTQYPEFDETPGLYPGNKGIYCWSWCPLHPDLPRIINQLYDETLEVFEADALHVGMDEVFLIASEACPRCKGKDPADLFARAVQGTPTYTDPHRS